MKLSLKQKALFQAIAILVVSVIAGVTISIAIAKIPAEAYPYIAMAALIGIGINAMYKLRLTSLEYEEKLKEMTKKD